MFAKTDLSKKTERDFKKKTLRLSEAVVRTCSVKKMFLKISQTSQENTCVGVSFLKSYRPEGYNFIKQRLQHRCFPVNFAKFLKNLFCRATANRCFWNFFVQT